MATANPHDPHAGQPILTAGAALQEARLVAIMLHGRGASAEDILGLASEFTATDIAYLAPQAAGSTWYPYSFLSPIPQNQPGLDSALGVIARLCDQLEGQGISSERIALMGFSQGACLTSEFAARRARRYAAIAVFSGGVIGPPGTPRDYSDGFNETPVFFGCSDVDPHIPLDRVRESAALFKRMGADVDERIYPRMPHTIIADEIQAVDALLRAK
jgi:predicted esterase